MIQHNKSHYEIKDFFENKWINFIASHYKQDTRLKQATTYALLGTGKRIRPSLALLCCQLGGKSLSCALAPAFAIEMLHTYSLVHDDLPLMDNDDMRRGRATVHKHFDEVTALLAGNALFSDAFFVLSNNDFANKNAVIAKLALACGSSGMLEGQMMDMHYTNKNIDIKTLKLMHLLKTGRLIEAACVVGSLCAEFNDEMIEDFEAYGRFIGISFQIIDDLIDNQPNTGKTAGKDLENNKNTYPKLIGKKASYDLVNKYTKKSLALLNKYKDKYNIKPLYDFTLQLTNRVF